MNTKFKFALSLAAAAVLGACSADGIDSADVENWPSDFSTHEYALVNPDLASYQFITAVTDANAKYADSARAALRESLIKAGSDSAAAADSAKKLKFSSTDSTQWNLFFSGDDAENAVKTIFTDYARISEDYWPGLSAFVNGMTDEEGNINIDGQRAMEYRTALGFFHTIGNTAKADLDFLQKIKVDSSLIKMQFIMAGKYEGRAYRFCREGEANVKQLDITVTYDTIVGGNKTYVWEQITKLDTNKSATKYALSSGDTLPVTAYNKRVEASEDTTGLTVLDTIYVVDSRPDSVKVDSVVTDKINKKTVVVPQSPRIIIPKGNKDRVWDFSADLYCKNESDGIVYLIGNL